MARKTTKKSAKANGKAGAQSAKGGTKKTKGLLATGPASAQRAGGAKSAKAAKASGKATSKATRKAKTSAGATKRAAGAGTRSTPQRPQVKSGSAAATRRRASAATPVTARKPVAPRATSAGGARPHVSANRSTAKRPVSALFAEAVERAMQGYLFDAVSLFRDVVESEPGGPLADDALFNIGTALLQMRMVNDAEKTFTELIEKYPESTIDAVYNGNEHGRTAAKALLGRMQARLAQGKFDEARQDREALAGYDDSWVTDPGGNRKSFRELAMAVMP